MSEQHVSRMTHTVKALSDLRLQWENITRMRISFGSDVF